MTTAIQDLRQTWTTMATALVAASLYISVILLLLLRSDDIAAAVVILHVLLVVSIPLVHLVLRDEDDRIVRLVVIALFLKMAGAFVRYYVSFGVYDTADARGYHEAGVAFAEAFRAGDFFLDLGGTIIGTRFIEVLTGVVYAITGPSVIGGFFVYAWLAFIGLLFFYRAFRISLPDADSTRYVYLLFFLPSLLYWPSSIGKDAWMVLNLGMATYGAALLMNRRNRAVVPLLLGLGGTALVRPHLTLTIVVALLAATVGARFGRGWSVPARVVVVLVVLISLVPLLGAVQRRFENDLGQVLYTSPESTAQGGSEFDPVAARSPVQVPLAVISVLFRPFLFEAGSPLALFAATESTFLLVLAVRYRRRLLQSLRRVRDHPYLVYAATYSLIFCIAFSSIANFGLLARQRSQLLPLVLVLLCAGAASVSSAGTGERAGVEPPVRPRAASATTPA